VAVTVRDPVHGSIALDEWVLPLINSPAFQRLRRVQQLGTAYLVYPGANHRRFEHSIGAHHLAGRLAGALGLDNEESLTLRAAALLHDLGHGPFSHAFEELEHHAGARHEDTTVDLVSWGPLADLLRQGGIDPVAVSEAVVGKGPLSGIVSGALDADRMDYLLRDAHYTGVRATVDSDRLIGVTERDDEHGLVLRESGILSAEALLTTRFLMYPAVYLHHTVRSSERMLQEGVRSFIQDGHATWKELERETDDGLLHRLRAVKGVPAEMVARLDERRLYKRAFTGGPGMFDQELVQQMLGDPKKRDEIAGQIADTAGVARHEVLLDVPKPPKFRESKLRVRQRDGASIPITEASSLVRILGDAKMDHWRLWVFSPKQHVDSVGAAAVGILGPSRPDLAG
jgi:HD superfamily phosphohydrolase